MKIELPHQARQALHTIQQLAAQIEGLPNEQPHNGLALGADEKCPQIRELAHTP